MRLLARCAFFLSGVAGLTFEIVWLRHMGLAVGATTLAVAVTVATYMAGLALGSHLAGRFADRLRRPVAVYGLLEIVIALLGLVIPVACKLVPMVDGHLLADAGGGTRALVRFFVAALVLLPPTTLMGMTLPVLARAVADKVGEVGREVGTLYAINIAGAVGGAALTGFVLVPALGLSKTNLVAVGLDLVLGVLAVVLGRGLMVAAHQPDAKAPVLSERGRALVPVLVVTGAAAMALQVLWTRALGTALGPSTYAFTAIVCAYLVGLAVGGVIASRLSSSVVSVRSALAVVLLLTAAGAWIGISLVDDLPVLLHRFVLDPRLTIYGLVQTEFALAALSLLPATIGMGAIFPLTLSAVVGSEERLGAAVGRAYAVNTAGNILGSFLGVFVLLPALGVEWGMRVAALSYVVVAGYLLLRLEPEVKKQLRQALAAATALAALTLVLWPSWNVGLWTAGLYRLSMARSYYPDAGEIETAKLVFHADGMSTTVTVEEDDDVRWIKVNGKIDGSSHGDMPTQVLSGLLPMLVHPAPKQVAVIGCGSCVTAGAALRGNPEGVTLIELEKEVVEAAHLFAAVNHEPWKDPRFTFANDDGRNYMMRPGPSFDVIISEPSNPWMTGASSLFTQEFFQIAQRRLTEGGMFLQWLQAYEMAPERIASVLKTFQSVFPNVLVFSAHPDSNDLLMLGSAQPITLDRARLERRFVDLQDEAKRAELESVDDLLALLLMSNAQFDALPPETVLNTDDNALIEFGAPKDLLTFAEADPQLDFLHQLAGRRAPLVRRLGGTGADAEATLRLAWSYARQGMLDDARATAGELLHEPTVPTAVAAEGLIVQEVAQLLSEGDESVTPPLLNGSRYVEALRLAGEGELDKALGRFEDDGASPPTDTAEKLLLGYLLYKDERYDSARRYFKAVLADAAFPHRVLAAYFVARASYFDGHYRRAVAEMKDYHALRQVPLSVAPRPR